MTDKDLSNYPAWLSNFIRGYHALGTTNLEILSEIYATNVEFHDAVHEINGLEELERYFSHLYTNLSSCTFIVSNAFYQDNQAAVYWQMTFVHRALNRGKSVTIEGHSLIKGQGDRVTYHQDYLDMGAMVYEHVPILGRFVRAIKLRMNNAA